MSGLPTNTIRQSATGTPRPPGPGRRVLKLGCCGAGSEVAVARLTQSTLDAALGTGGASAVGPLASSARYHLGSALGGAGPAPLYGLVLPTADEGVVADTLTAARVGSSTGEFATSGTVVDGGQLRVKVVRAGAPGAATVRVSLDDGRSYGPERAVPTSGELVVAELGITITLDAAVDAGDEFYATATPPQWQVSDLAAAIDVAKRSGVLLHYLHLVGFRRPEMSAVVKSRGASPTITLGGTPSGYHDFALEITTGAVAPGSITDIRFRWSVNGGVSWTSGVHGASGAITLTGSGLTVTLGDGTYQTGDTYTSHGLKGLRDTADTLRSLLEGLRTSGTFLRAMIEAPTGASDAVVIKAMAGFAQENSAVHIAARWFEGIQGSARPWLSYAAEAVARLGIIPLHEDLGRAKSGPANGVNRLGTTDSASELADNHFVVGYQLEGLDGVLLHGGAMDAGPFDRIQYHLVLDEASRVARARLVLEDGDDKRTNPSDGTLLPIEANAIDTAMDAELAVSLLTSAGRGPHANAARARVDREANFALTRTLSGTVEVIPLFAVEAVDWTVALRQTFSA